MLDGITDTGEISEEAERRVMDALKGSFRPEFLNRLDEIICFKPLTKSNITSIIDLLVKDINRRLDDKELSVEKICSHLGVSAAYFSTVFKKETGKSFTNFLTDVRMNRAVELLLNQEGKTYIIAEAVGYSDPNYFSYVFKKQFGVSPSKYKQGMRAG